MRRTMVALVMMVAAVMTVGQVLAQETPPAGERAMEAVAVFLGLDADQVAAWQVLLEERHAASAPLAEELHALGAELRELIATPGADPCEVGALVLAGQALGGELRTVHQAYVAAFEALLDGEQAQRLQLIRRAERVQRLLPAFRALGLLAPPPDGAGGGGGLPGFSELPEPALF